MVFVCYAIHYSMHFSRSRRSRHANAAPAGWINAKSVDVVTI